MRLSYFFFGSLSVVTACNGGVMAPLSGDAASPADGASDAGVADANSAADVDSTTATDGCSGPGFDASAYVADAAAAAIGTPCLPVEEKSPTFTGFNDGEINLTRNPNTPSGAPVCLVYHFRGLVTCPYGQSADAGCAAPCATSTGAPVVGAVEAQCADRPASSVVLWSCRCANPGGMTNDGESYCTCPSGTTCTQALSSIGAAEDDVSGGYCLPPTIAFNAKTSCAVSCNPASAPCP